MQRNLPLSFTKIYDCGDIESIYETSKLQIRKLEHIIEQWPEKLEQSCNKINMLNVDERELYVYLFDFLWHVTKGCPVSFADVGNLENLRTVGPHRTIIKKANLLTIFFFTRANVPHFN